MNINAEELIEQLTNPVTRQSTIDSLIQQGKATVPIVLKALEQFLKPQVHKILIWILLEIRDPETLPVIRDGLNSSDEAIRALCARGLHLFGEKDALDACLTAINDSPDPLHFDSTPAVTCLIEIGMPALAPILGLLDAEHEDTRQRAQKVLELITFQHVQQTSEEWASLWEENGNYNWKMSRKQRQQSIQLWRKWLKEQYISEG